MTHELTTNLLTRTTSAITDEKLAASTAALADGLEATIATASEAAAAAGRDRALSPAGVTARRGEIAETATAEIDRFAKRAEALRADADRACEGLRQSVVGHDAQRLTAAERREVRDVFRSIDEAERPAYLRAATLAGDAGVVQAIAESPPSMRLVDDELLTDAALTIARELQPERAAAFDNLEATATTVELNVLTAREVLARVGQGFVAADRAPMAASA